MPLNTLAQGSRTFALLLLSRIGIAKACRLLRNKKPGQQVFYIQTIGDTGWGNEGD
jgi:hypothetical protein